MGFRRDPEAWAALPRGQGGQSTVEFALLLPVIVTVLLLILQAGLVMRDQLVAVSAVRTAARAVIVDPQPAAATAALRRQGGPAATAAVSVSGDRSPGSLATVRIRLRPTRVPIVGRVVARVVLQEELTVLVEGPS